jgi:hypothetical protein
VKVHVKGRGEVTLSTANFVAEGGQAAVYQKNGTAYKIYADPKNAIPETKFLELARIDDPNVIKPTDLLIDPATHAPVGYTMRFVSDTLALCQVFPRAFRERVGVSPENTCKLVARLQERVAHVHRGGALVVDLNELNVLVPQALDDVFLIDVDSYQTASFHAEFIMPSVRDWSVKPPGWSEGSDWFAFAILAFQLYVGIHPYRGTHSATAALPPAERLEARMRQKLSALGPGVSLPKAAYPLDVIPEVQRRWMRAVLQEGLRAAPPATGAAPVAIITPKLVVQSFGSVLDVSTSALFESPLLAYVESGGQQLALTEAGIVLNGRLAFPGKPPGQALIGFTPKQNIPVAIVLERGEVTLVEVAGRRSARLQIGASEIAKSGDRFYAKVRDQVYQLEFIESGTLMVVAGPAVASVTESSSRLFDGCVIQKMVGSTFVSLFPKSAAGYQVRVAELDGYRIIDARFERGVLMVIGAGPNGYDRLVFRFEAPSFSSYDANVVANITPAGLNFVVTDGGVCVFINEEDKLEAFSAKPGVSATRIVEDASIGVTCDSFILDPASASCVASSSVR